MFIAYDVSLELIRCLRPLIPTIKKYDRDLADQLRRAATSVSLNLGEGRRRDGGDQRRHYEMAHGSAGEVRTALDVADAWGVLVDDDRAKQVLDRLLALLWRLTHGRVRLPDTRDSAHRVSAPPAVDERTSGSTAPIAPAESDVP